MLQNGTSPPVRETAAGGTTHFTRKSCSRRNLSPLRSDKIMAVKKYWHVLNVGIQNNLTYRFNFLARRGCKLHAHETVSVRCVLTAVTNKWVFGREREPLAVP